MNRGGGQETRTGDRVRRQGQEKGTRDRDKRQWIGEDKRHQTRKMGQETKEWRQDRGQGG